MPVELGLKDALHVAIASCRAGERISPGGKVKLNDNGEAVRCNGKGVGVADPFRNEEILRGDSFWVLLGGTEVPNVRHVWDHPKFDFAPPTRPVERLKYVEQYAEQLKVPYDRLLADCKKAYEQGDSLPYPGEITDEEEFYECEDIFYEIWYEVEDELGLEYENVGSACCPEYDHPTLYHWND